MLFICGVSVDRHKDLSIGEFGVMFIAVGEWTFAIRRVMTFIQNANTKSLGIEVLRKFMESEIADVHGGESIESIESIEFRDVSFAYADQPALRQVNLTVRKGETVAIVGPNGAGKTTLIKLLLGLYEPQTGEILVNGKSLPAYDQAQYRRCFAVAFQDFAHFGLTVKENVALGAEQAMTDEAVWRILEDVGLRKTVEQLPEGIHTIVGREFEERGVVFSGGEAQKLALARMRARPYEVAVMDEPSSKLDPIAEQ